MRFLLVCLMLIPASFCFGQKDSQGAGSFDDVIKRIKEKENGDGTITITQDQKVARLLDQYLFINSKNPGMNGFRIRVYRDLGQKSRKQSEDIEKTIMEKYPGVSVYRTYQSPYYKVSVGDFRTRDNAMKLYNQLLKTFPKAFIVPEWINFPPLE